MKDKLISFETAKLAKEKGFNIPVRYAFYTEKDKRDLRTRTQDWNNHFVWVGSSWGGHNTNPFYSRPTQSLLQKWLREVHKVNVSISFYDDGKNKYWTCHIHKDSSQQAYVCGEDVYEDALEKGLFEGLKYVK